MRLPGNHFNRRNKNTNVYYVVGGMFFLFLVLHLLTSSPATPASSKPFRVESPAPARREGENYRNDGRHSSIANDVVTKDLDLSHDGSKPWISIYSFPKPFKSPYDVTQTNAIMSWYHIKPRPEIILIGDEVGVAEFAAKHGLKHIKEAPGVAPDVKIPLLSEVVRLGEKLATADYAIYINADIMLPQTIYPTVMACQRLFKGKPFMVTGVRFNLLVQQIVDFPNMQGWFPDAHMGDETGQDFWVYPKGGLDIPKDLNLLFSWDNWMISWFINNHGTAVDATTIVKSIHQDHPYVHQAATKKDDDVYHSSAARRDNRILALTTVGGPFYTITKACNYKAVECSTVNNEFGVCLQNRPEQPWEFIDLFPQDAHEYEKMAPKYYDWDLLTIAAIGAGDARCLPCYLLSEGAKCIHKDKIFHKFLPGQVVTQSVGVFRDLMSESSMSELLNEGDIERFRALWSPVRDRVKAWAVDGGNYAGCVNPELVDTYMGSSNQLQQLEKKVKLAAAMKSPPKSNGLSWTWDMVSGTKANHDLALDCMVCYRNDHGECVHQFAAEYRRHFPKITGEMLEQPIDNIVARYIGCDIELARGSKLCNKNNCIVMQIG
eukprot:GFYU01006452.1.p1 GENE.GFYU01006452.1~~GFYU01006452.1.p1  ORF type:complete len:604 (+),score=39.01 GFYU01006452.1:32-1843(+)